MTRERKFRAWIDGKMIYIHQQLSISFFNAPNAVNWAIYNKIGGGQIYKGDAAEEGSELMEFIGISDKNDQQIYEGDILSRWGNKYIVIWDNSPQGFRMKWINEDCVNRFPDNLCEVIGNVFENPDEL